AYSSRFGGDERRCGSSLSVASRLSSDSSEATTARVIAACSTAGSKHRPKSGKCSKSDQPIDVARTTGTVTKCDSVIAQLEPVIASSSLTRVPITTAHRAPGSNLCFSLVRSQQISSTNDKRPTKVAPGTTWRIARCSDEKVFSPSAWANDMSPS